MKYWRQIQSDIYPIFRDAIIILTVSAIVACLVNLVRPDSLDWFASQDYDILVPCPEPMGEATALRGEQARSLKSDDLLIDAREADEYAKWHPLKSINITFDYLTPVSDEAIRQIAATRAHRVIVGGDGGDPDSGEQLAKEISGRGIKNVHYLIGGMERFKIICENQGNE